MSAGSVRFGHLGVGLGDSAIKWVGLAHMFEYLLSLSSLRKGFVWTTELSFMASLTLW